MLQKAFCQTHSKFAGGKVGDAPDGIDGCEARPTGYNGAGTGCHNGGDLGGNSAENSGWKGADYGGGILGKERRPLGASRVPETFRMRTSA